MRRFITSSALALGCSALVANAQERTRSRTETKNAMPEFRVTSIKPIGQC